MSHDPATLPNTDAGKLLTDAASIAAIISPWWLPILQHSSVIAAALLPFFGLAWFAVQIFFKIYRELKNGGINKGS